MDRDFFEMDFCGKFWSFRWYFDLCIVLYYTLPTMIGEVRIWNKPRANAGLRGFPVDCLFDKSRSFSFNRMAMVEILNPKCVIRPPNKDSNCKKIRLFRE